MRWQNVHNQRRLICLDAAEFVAFPRKLYQVVENSSVSFPCNGVGIPAVTTEWQTSNQTLLFFNSSMPNRYQMLDNGNLVIESAERSDSGKFTCKISNDVGYPAIATSYLQVQCKLLRNIVTL